EEMKELAAFIKQHKTIKIQSVFTHLAASDDKKYDDFTHQQFEKFREAVQYLKKKIKDSFLAHIANSSAVVRYPDMQMDMVRLGIGMYGVDYSNTKSLNLQTVATLKSTIAQIKILQAGESVSYNRQTIVNKETKIATIRIGYADGYPRRLGNGIGRVWLKGKQVPIIGTVCMDMLMIDISTVTDVKIGDEVQLFGDAISIREVAAWAGTIAYEIMTGISQRVKRVYFQE
nr:alanine racemase [Chitinophagaceae bacterium]